MRKIPWWELIVIAILAFLFYGIVTNDGHDQIMSVVSFWGVLICWKIDEVLEKIANTASLRPIVVNVTDTKFERVLKGDADV